MPTPTNTDAVDPYGPEAVEEADHLATPAEEVDASGVDDAATRLARRPWPSRPAPPELEISFEFMPPGTEAGVAQLDGCAEQLSPLAPSFVSVTYGAGGSNRDRTFAAIERLATTTDFAIAGHLTTVAASRETTLGVVDRFRELGVSRIVALRGDPPADGAMPDAPGFETAADLVAGLRDHLGDAVDIAVAAYPEVHPKASSAQADLDSLKAKIDAGANRAITQFFLDNDDFLRFEERCRAAGITVPIHAGIMPITSFERIASFAGRIGAAIPSWMPDLFEGIDSPEIHQLVAANLAAEQCRELAEHGVNHFHFYTMNRPELTGATCRILGVRPRAAQTATQAETQAATQTATLAGAGPA